MNAILMMMTLILAMAAAGADAPNAAASGELRGVTPAVGEMAPDFTLEDQNGEKVTLSKTREEKVVLVFYRGYW